MPLVSYKDQLRVKLARSKCCLCGQRPPIKRTKTVMRGRVSVIICSHHPVQEKRL
jgi:hypothetical protein